ncbi:MAG: hypothetical protein ACYTDY_09300 [Planctomycetota bacterium]|jgi:hypothetical protein
MQKTVFASSTIFVLVLSFALVGCASAQLTRPHMGFSGVGIDTKLDRSDIVVLGRVEGESTVTSILGGLFATIDGNKQRIFGIKFFKDKYTSMKPEGNLMTNPLGILDFIAPVSVDERAYYKALEAHPDADAVFAKSMSNEESGFWPFFTTQTVRFQGKAIKIKEDQ